MGGICSLCFQKPFRNIFVSTTIDLKYLDKSFKFLKLFTKCIAQNNAAPDMLLVYYLGETVLFWESIWAKYLAEKLGRNIHLMVLIFTNTKYHEFKNWIPAWLQILILQHYSSSGVVFSFTIIISCHFCFHYPQFLCNFFCLIVISNAEKGYITANLWCKLF